MPSDSFSSASSARRPSGRDPISAARVRFTTLDTRSAICRARGSRSESESRANHASCEITSSGTSITTVRQSRLRGQAIIAALASAPRAGGQRLASGTNT